MRIELIQLVELPLKSDLKLFYRRNLLIPHASITRSQSSVYERERDAQEEARRGRSGSQGHLSFEEVCRQRTLDSPVSIWIVLEFQKFFELTDAYS